MADWQFWALMSAIFWVSLRVEAVNDRLGDVQREQRRHGRGPRQDRGGLGGGAEGRAHEDPEG